MADTFLERFVNHQGTSWVRAHGMGVEGFAFCSMELQPDADGIAEGKGQITCPDCIAVIKACKSVADSDLAPEYDNDLFHRRFGKDR